MTETYWNKQGVAQDKYDEMRNAEWAFTKKSLNVFHRYYRYYNDGDLPGWARSRWDLTHYRVSLYGAHRELNLEGERELEDTVTEAVLNEWARYQKAQQKKAQPKPVEMWVVVKDGVVLFRDTEAECGKIIAKDVSGMLEMYPESARV